MRSPEEYAQLPYHFRLLPDRWADGTPGWFVMVEELEGCMSQGETPDEAIERARDAIVAWVDDAQVRGEPVPEPRDDGAEEYSGKLTVRVSRRLHRLLVEEAERQNVSVNQLCATALAEAVGAAQERVRADAFMAAVTHLQAQLAAAFSSPVMKGRTQVMEVATPRSSAVPTGENGG